MGDAEYKNVKINYEVNDLWLTFCIALAYKGRLLYGCAIWVLL